MTGLVCLLVVWNALHPLVLPFPGQHSPIAELSLPKAPSRWAGLSPVTAAHKVCITLMMFRSPLHGSLNRAPSLGTVWPRRLCTNLEVVKICADLQVFTRYPW